MCQALALCLQVPLGSVLIAPTKAKSVKTQLPGSMTSIKFGIVILMWLSVTSWIIPTLMAILIVSHMLRLKRMESGAGTMLCWETLHGIIQYVL